MVAWPGPSSLGEREFFASQAPSAQVPRYQELSFLLNLFQCGWEEGLRFVGLV